MLDPQDIRKHEFTRAWRGYDRDEVHALLDSIAREFEELTRRHQTQAGELKTLRDETARYQKSEKTLQDAALTLQQALDEKRRLAEQEATGLLQETRLRIAEESLAAQARIDAVRAELQTLENERARFYLRFQNLLNEQAALLESLMDTRPKDAQDDGVA
jgi:cell division initiation protein